MTPDEAIAELLGRPTDQPDHVNDLIEAAKVGYIRQAKTRLAVGAVIYALQHHHTSYRDIQGLTGIPKSTAHDWAKAWAAIHGVEEE